MRLSLFITIAALAALPIFAADNELSGEEKRQGWKLLFNGKNLEGWRSFGKETGPEKGWVVEDGTLHLPARSKGGDIVSADAYEQFELSWEWRIAPKANNGLKYFILPSRKQAIGHEYQMIDDAGTKNSKHSTASFYDVLPPQTPERAKPAGEWNHSQIIVKGQSVEHWLNGTKVLGYTLGSPEVKAAVAASKFKEVSGFGERVKGLILLTDHNDAAWYRNVKVRDLSKGS